MTDNSDKMLWLTTLINRKGLNLLTHVESRQLSSKELSRTTLETLGWSESETFDLKWSLIAYKYDICFHNIIKPLLLPFHLLEHLPAVSYLYLKTVPMYLFQKFLYKFHIII